MRPSFCFAMITLLSFPVMAQSVTLKMCRNTRFTSMSDSKTVTVHQGYTFAQDMPGHKRLGAILRVDRDVRIAPHSCATGQATVATRLGHAPITSHTALLQQFDDGFDLKTRVTGGFD